MRPDLKLVTEKTGLFTTYSWVSCTVCLLVGVNYCFAMTNSSLFWQNVFSCLFTTFLGSLFFLNLKKMDLASLGTLHVIFSQIILIHLGLVFTAQILGSPESFFWVQDSINFHLPESIKFAEFFKSGHWSLKNFIKLNNGRGIVTHSTTGLSILLFGVNTFATFLVQLGFKVLTMTFIFLIGRTFWNRDIGVLATLLYGLCPTIFFYNLVLYKEGAVQALVAMVVFCTVKVARKKFSYLLVALVPYCLLYNERFYIAILMAPMTAACVLYSIPKNTKARLAAVAVSALAIGVLDFYYRLVFVEWVVSSFKTLADYRAHYSSFSDVMNKYNYEIPIPVAVFKILFSPFFTLNKFTLFADFSLLLIWGSFFNQIIIAFSLFGLYRSLKKRFLHLLLWMPFGVFVLFAAYISPWSGRLRDSFYPLISCYAAFYVCTSPFFRKYFSKKHVSSNDN